MASLHRRKNSPSIFLSYRDANGVRRMKCVGKNEVTAAEELAKACRREERRRLGQSTSAEDKLDEAADLALDELVVEYREHLVAEGRSATHVGDVKKILNTFVEHLGAGAKLADVAPDAIRNFIGQRRALVTSNVVEHEGAGPRTANRWRSLIGGFCSWLLTTDRLAANPVDRVRVAKVGEPRVRRRALTDDELTRLLAAADAHGDRVGLWVRMGAFAGLRRGELRRLRWRHVDLDAGVLTITPDIGKAKGRRDVLPLHGELLDRLKAWRPALTLDPTALVFPLPVSDELRRQLFTEAAIAVESDDGKADFHALRSTLTTRLARAGATPIAMQKMLRHSAFRTTDEHYLKMTADDLRAGLPGFAVPKVAPAAARQAAGGEHRQDDDSVDQGDDDGPGAVTANKSSHVRCNAPGERVNVGASSGSQIGEDGIVVTPDANKTTVTTRERIGAGVPRGLQIRRGALQRSQVGSIPMRSRHAGADGPAPDAGAAKRFGGKRKWAASPRKPPPTFREVQLSQGLLNPARSSLCLLFPVLFQVPRRRSRAGT